MGAASCDKAPGAPELRVKGRAYISDSRTQSIVRQVGQRPDGRPIIEQITCSNPAFDNRVCYTIDEVRAHQKELIEASWKCQQWKQ